MWGDLEGHTSQFFELSHPDFLEKGEPEKGPPSFRHADNSGVADEILHYKAIPPALP
jgi:hypothetical protein